MIHFKHHSLLKDDVVMVYLTQDDLKADRYPETGLSLRIIVQDVVRDKIFEAREAVVFPISHDGKLILLCGLGREKDLTPTQLRIYVRKSLTSPFLENRTAVSFCLNQMTDEFIRAMIDGVLLGGYCWNKYKSCRPKKPVEYTILVKNRPLFKKWATVCEGVNFTRNLVNDNADVVNSEFLEKHVITLIQGCGNVKVEVLNQKEMKAKGLHLHLAVNQGSPREPKLVIVKYTGAGKGKPYTALIGKGMTFDTGGLNLKPTGNIETMKMDMGGAAAVIGALRNTIKLKLKVNVIFAVGLAENVIGSSAYKPGDVIIGYAGKSVEVANTDAEGRLVLADAIAYVKKNYQPRCIIDIATLTGACIVALGHDHTGLVSTDDELAELLISSGKQTDDWVWRLPSYSQLKESVKSQIADIRNLGQPRGAAGALTAAEFLRQFAEGENVSWAHLDIAGTCYAEGHGRFYYGYGATGAGVRLLTDVIEKLGSFKFRQ